MKGRMLALACALAMLGGSAAAEGNAMTLLAINVGKGDCLLLHSGQTIYLIDVGTAESWGATSSALKQLGVDHLNGVIVTHTDEDHAGGAWPLAMSGIGVDAWYAPRYYTDVKEAKHPVALAAALRDEQVTWLDAGDQLPLDGGRLTVLGPMSHNRDAENCNSLVLLAEGGGGRMLLCGDMEFPEEQELLEAGVIPHCEVLKVGNHGEEDATSAQLVSLVKPQVAVISTSTVQEPDTPSDRVMGLLRQSGAKILQTQHAPVAVMVVLQDGRLQTSNLSSGELPPRNQDVLLSDKSAKTDSITVTNHGGAAVDMDGWYIRSERGNQMFVFRGVTLGPGEQRTITSLSGEGRGDLIWPDKKVWHKSKDDAAYLYDVYGRLIHQID